MSRPRNPRFSRLILFLFVVTILILSIIIKQQIQRREAPSIEETGGKPRVIDGDTFVDSQGRTIRLLGIDTPEKGEPYYGEAKADLAQLLAGKSLRFELGREPQDRYGRLLAFVFVEDTVLVNARLIEDGMARTYFFEANISGGPYGDRLCQAQQQAHRQRKGIWSLKVENAADRYFGNPHTLRFHRPSCNSIERSDTTKLIRDIDRGRFIDQCYSPCRNCKP